MISIMQIRCLSTDPAGLPDPGKHPGADSETGGKSGQATPISPVPGF